MADDEVLYATSGHVATLTLNRPDRMNTISMPMLRQLSERLLEADADRSVRVIVVTGVGRAFCAGLDLQDAAAGTGIGGGGGSGGFQSFDLRNSPPTVLFNI